MATLDIGLVACSRLKADRPLPARELYVSPLFRAARAYAERRYGPEGWLILSARYGVVHPDQVLAPYDLSLRQLTAAEREAWGDRAALELTDRFPAGTVLWFHAGILYRDAIAPVVAHPVRAPLAGLGIGQQLGWYYRHRADGRLTPQPGPPTVAHRFQSLSMLSTPRTIERTFRRRVSMTHNPGDSDDAGRAHPTDRRLAS